MARRQTRVLPFPLRMDPSGQFDLFPEPLAPSPFTSTQLAIRLSLLQHRVVRMAPHLHPIELLDVFGQEELLEAVVEKYEALAAKRQAIQHQAQLDRTA